MEGRSFLKESIESKKQKTATTQGKNEKTPTKARALFLRTVRMKYLTTMTKRRNQ